MHSPFHSVMTTPVLDARELARLMRHHSARAHHGAEASCRDDEEDAVLLGKLLLLDDLAWRMESKEMSATETTELRAATNELGRAVETLTARIVAASKVAADASAGDLTEDEGGGPR